MLHVTADIDLKVRFIYHTVVISLFGLYFASLYKKNQHQKKKARTPGSANTHNGAP